MSDAAPPAVSHLHLLLGAVGLAMGIAVFVLSFIHAIDAEHALPLLAIAVICFGISALVPRK